MRTMSLFAGAGGGLLADLILGHEPVVAVEWDRYACQVLRERVADGWFPGMQVWEGDVRLFDPSEYKGRVDCIHAGFPCQDISVAGSQRGIGEGTRSNLYREALRIAGAIRPRYIFLENVAAITSKSKGYLEVIGKDLAEIGYDAVWTTLSAAEVCAKHRRDRWWLLAFPSVGRCGSWSDHREERHIQNNKERESSEVQLKGNEREPRVGKTCAVFPNTSSEQNDKKRGISECRWHGMGWNSETSQQNNREAGDDSTRRRCKYVAYPNTEGLQRRQETGDIGSQRKRREQQPERCCDNSRSARTVEPPVCRMVDDVANQLHPNAWNEVEAQVGRITDETENRVSRLKCLGNGQVPLQAAVAFKILLSMAEVVRNQNENELSPNEGA